MTRGDQGQQSGKIGAQPDVGFKEGVLFAGMGRGGSDYRPIAYGIPQGGKRRRIGRRCGHVKLEIAGRKDLGCPKFAEARCVGGSARKAEVEPLQKMRDGVRKAPPAPERIL